MTRAPLTLDGLQGHFLQAITLWKPETVKMALHGVVIVDHDARGAAVGMAGEDIALGAFFVAEREVDVHFHAELR